MSDTTVNASEDTKLKDNIHDSTQKDDNEPLDFNFSFNPKKQISDLLKRMEERDNLTKWMTSHITKLLEKSNHAKQIGHEYDAHLQNAISYFEQRREFEPDEEIYNSIKEKLSQVKPTHICFLNMDVISGSSLWMALRGFQKRKNQGQKPFAESVATLLSAYQNLINTMIPTASSDQDYDLKSLENISSNGIQDMDALIEKRKASVKSDVHFIEESMSRGTIQLSNQNSSQLAQDFNEFQTFIHTCGLTGAEFLLILEDLVPNSLTYKAMMKQPM